MKPQGKDYGWEVTLIRGNIQKQLLNDQKFKLGLRAKVKLFTREREIKKMMVFKYNKEITEPRLEEAGSGECIAVKQKSGKIVKSQNTKETKHKTDQLRLYYIGNGKTKVFNQENISKHTEAEHMMRLRNTEGKKKKKKSKGILQYSLNER